MSVGECAQDLAGFACCLACLFGDAPVFLAVLRIAGGQVFMDAGDVVFTGGYIFDLRPRLLAQGPGPLDHSVRVRQPGHKAPFAFRRRPLNLRLLTPVADLRPLERRLLAVQLFPAQSQQRTGTLDDIPGALLQRADRLTDPLCALTKLALTLGKPLLQAAQRSLPLIRPALPLIRRGLALVGAVFPLIRPALPLIGQAAALIGHLIAFFSRPLARFLGLAPR